MPQWFSKAPSASVRDADAKQELAGEGRVVNTVSLPTSWTVGRQALIREPVFEAPAEDLVAGAAEVVVGETVAAALAVDGPPVAALCAGEAGAAPLPHAARTTPPNPAARPARAWRRLRCIEWVVFTLDMSFTAFSRY